MGCLSISFAYNRENEARPTRMVHHTFDCCLVCNKEFSVLHIVNGFRRKTALPHRRPSTRLTLEHLEDRQVLSVSYHGGALLTSVSIEPVYYGRDWHNATYLQQAANLNTFLGTIATSPYMDMLGEYNVGKGSLADSGVIDNGVAAGQWVDDTQIQQMLATDIARGLVPPPTANRLYMVYTA